MKKIMYRRLYEQLSKRNKRGVATGQQQGAWVKSIIGTALASTLLLAGAAHATDVNVTGKKNGDVVYSYDAASTPHALLLMKGTYSSVCIKNPSPSTYGLQLATFGLALRQTTGYAKGAVEYSTYGAVAQEFSAPFTSNGGIPQSNVAVTHPEQETGFYRQSLSAGRTEIYVVDASKLPSKTTSLGVYVYPIATMTWSNLAPGTACGNNIGPEDFPSNTSHESGYNRRPTPDGTVTLVVNSTVQAKSKVHTACTSGGHAGVCQRLHSFVATHKH